MKKATSLILVALMGALLFAASFKKGETVYVSKDGTVQDGSGFFSKKLGSVKKGEVGTVVDTASSKAQVEFKSGLKGWIKTNNLTTKKIAGTTTTALDNFALSGKGSVSADGISAPEGENQDGGIQGIEPAKN